MTTEPTYEELEQRVKELEEKASKHKEVERELRESQVLLENILMASAFGIAHAKDRKIIWANQAMREMFGFSHEDQFIGQDTDILYADESEYRRVGRIIYEHQRSAKVVELDAKFKHQDGTIFDAYVKVNILDPSDPMEGIIVNIIDITERKRSEEEREKLRAQLSNAVEMAHLGPWEYDVANDLFIFNDYFYKIFHTTAEHVGGYTMSSTDYACRFIHPEDIPVVRKEFQKAIKTTDINFSRQLEHRILHPDGTVGYVIVRFFVEKDANGRTVRSYGVIQNITERKQAEEALRESRKHLRLFIDSSPDLCFLKDRAGKYLLLNTANVQFFGKKEADLIGKTDFDLMQEGAAQYCRESDSRAIQEKKMIISMEEIDKRLYETRKMPVIMDNRVVGVAGIIRDITERKRAEDALRESEEKYRLLIENATDAIFIAQDEALKFANPKAEKMTGYSAEQLAEMPFIDIIHPEDRTMVLERHVKRLNGEEPPSVYSFRIVNRSGEELSVELNAVIINWEGRPATLNFLRDITAQKRLEAQLQRAQKMEALGTLAGGIAHDFNNLLMAIQGRASIILMHKDPSDPDFEYLRGIERHVESAADLTRQLLGFARGGKYEVKPTDLNELIKKENLMFGRTKKEITIHDTYAEDLWSVEIDRGQIEQVVLNLYVNASQAMPGGGDLYVETENVVLNQNDVKPFSTESGKYVKLSVTDTGVGMDKATQERIFDPFFTTKKMGRGTGLGLASVYGIVKNHGGFINVYSEKGQGTTFTIYLPASEKTIIEEKDLGGDALKGTETVLLVDDEDIVIEVAEQLLEQLGYKVLTARSGKEAVEICEGNMEQIDIVVLDMIMPDMNGGDAYERMKEMNPKVKVLLSSGYSINGHATEILDRGCNGFIQKPFKIEELSQQLRKILDEK
ncbi:MAG: PAS domain S-box protein [Deltaproteobacteria bacterium]|nr:PAS domain S-box protein [Deltaproteobacteria bacterium]